jgi:hypothetical protein
VIIAAAADYEQPDRTPPMPREQHQFDSAAAQKIEPTRVSRHQIHDGQQCLEVNFGRADLGELRVLGRVTWMGC